MSRPHLAVVPPNVNVAQVEDAWRAIRTAKGAPSTEHFTGVNFATWAGGTASIYMHDREAFFAWAEHLGLAWQVKPIGRRSLYSARGDVNGLVVELAHSQFSDEGDVIA